MKSTSDARAITGLILAGGMGRRMDSRDKGLVEFRGMRMVAHAIERLAPQVDTLIINANRNLDTYSAFGFRVVSDRIDGFAGPLAGLHTGMRARVDDMHEPTRAYASERTSELIVTVPCDSPFLPLDLVKRLHDALQKENADIAVASTSGQLQPVFALYKLASLPSLEQFLTEGGRKIDKWYEQHKTVAVEFEDEHAFANINTLRELEEFARRMTNDE
jgi:molybdenum cofactor guanylyltransferase